MIILSELPFAFSDIVSFVLANCAQQQQQTWQRSKYTARIRWKSGENCISTPCIFNFYPNISQLSQAIQDHLRRHQISHEESPGTMPPYISPYSQLTPMTRWHIFYILVCHIYIYCSRPYIFITHQQS